MSASPSQHSPMEGVTHCTSPAAPASTAVTPPARDSPLLPPAGAENVAFSPIQAADTAPKKDTAVSTPGSAPAQRTPDQHHQKATPMATPTPQRATDVPTHRVNFSKKNTKLMRGITLVYPHPRPGFECPACMEEKKIKVRLGTQEQAAAHYNQNHTKLKTYFFCNICLKPQGKTLQGMKVHLQAEHGLNNTPAEPPQDIQLPTDSPWQVVTRRKSAKTPPAPSPSPRIAPDPGIKARERSACTSPTYAEVVTGRETPTTTQRPPSRTSPQTTARAGDPPARTFQLTPTPNKQTIRATEPTRTAETPPLLEAYKTHAFLVPFDGDENICPVRSCKKRFSSHNSTYRHLDRSHGYVTHTFKCRYCQHEWTQLKQAHSHIRTRHPKEWAESVEAKSETPPDPLPTQTKAQRPPGPASQPQIRERTKAPRTSTSQPPPGTNRGARTPPSARPPASDNPRTTNPPQRRPPDATAEARPATSRPRQTTRGSHTPPSQPPRRPNPPQTRSDTTPSEATGAPTPDDDADLDELLGRPATKQQKAWIDRIQVCDTQEELDGIMASLIDGIRSTIEQKTAEYTARAEKRKGKTNNQHRTPPPTTQPATPPEQPEDQAPQEPAQAPNNQYRPLDSRNAARLQQLFRDNMKSAYRQITEERSPPCPVDHDSIIQHFAPPTDEVLTADQIEDDSQEYGLFDIFQDNFTTNEVWQKLKRTNDSSPGLDKIRYKHWQKYDCNGHILTALFNRCRDLGKIPDSWKPSKTILLHKKGNLEEAGNWRPIALINTVARLFTSCMSTRLIRLFSQNPILSPQQKGFLPTEGCLEHNFVLQSIITDVKRRRKQVVVAWLDLKNAFGSVPHKVIFEALHSHKMNFRTRKLIFELYNGATTSFTTAEGQSDQTPIQSGVKQGCPLSPLIFNIALDHLIKDVASLARTHGYTIHGQAHSILAYADDMVLISSNPGGLQHLLNRVGMAATAMGLQFNAAKCATFHLAKHEALPTAFSIQGGRPPTLTEDDHYTYLGRPTGYKPFISVAATVEELTEELNKLDASDLAPWQKLEATNVFILSRLSFLLRSGFVLKKEIGTLDNTIRILAKKWAYLPDHASTEPLYLPYKSGGFNLFPLRTLADIVTTVQAHKFLHSDDPMIRALAQATLDAAASARTRRQATSADLPKYLNGSMEGDIGLPSNDTTCLWSRARVSSEHLRRKLQISWHDSGQSPTLQLEGATLKSFNAEKRLKAAHREHLLSKLQAKRSQGQVSRCNADSQISHHFIQKGDYTRFADWRFVNCARLNVLRNNAVTWTTEDKKCRRCGKEKETLLHILDSCKPNMVDITKRHNLVVDKIVAAMAPETVAKTRLNLTVPMTTSTSRPDIVVFDAEKRTCTIVDVTCPFDNDVDAIPKARQGKITTYTPLADHLRRKGFTVNLGAIVICALGSFDNENLKSLKYLGIPRGKATKLSKQLVSEVIRASKNIYYAHIHSQPKTSAAAKPTAVEAPAAQEPETRRPQAADQAPEETPAAQAPEIQETPTPEENPEAPTTGPAPSPDSSREPSTHQAPEPEDETQAPTKNKRSREEEDSDEEAHQTKPAKKVPKSTPARPAPTVPKPTNKRSRPVSTSDEDEDDDANKHARQDTPSSYSPSPEPMEDLTELVELDCDEEEEELRKIFQEIEEEERQEAAEREADPPMPAHEDSKTQEEDCSSV